MHKAMGKGYCTRNATFPEPWCPEGTCEECLGGWYGYNHLAADLHRNNEEP